MRVELYSVNPMGAGTLSVLPRPRGDDWLEDEMRSLADQGVSTLVSLLTSRESEELGLSEEGTLANQAGIDFVAFPIEDRSVPNASAFSELLTSLDAVLKQGDHVAVHCRLGVGRSSLVAVGLLRKQGTPASEAWKAVATARRLDVPDTPEQRAWLDALSLG